MCGNGIVDKNFQACCLVTCSGAISNEAQKYHQYYPAYIDTRMLRDQVGISWRELIVNTTIMPDRLNYFLVGVDGQ
jgi:hypothetical protein